MKYDSESIQRRRKIEMSLKKIVNVLLIIVIYNILLVMISAMNNIEQIQILGYKAYVITTNSMEPNIKAGDAIIVKKGKEENLKVNDVITFQKGANRITHRITEIIDKEGQKIYITKGDSNKIEDTEGVTYDKVLGKKIIRIPYLGKILNVLNNQLVFLIFVFILLVLYFWKIVAEDKKENRREKRIEED